MRIDGQPDPTEPGSERYVAPRFAPVFATLFLAALGATLLVVAIVGFLPLLRPGNTEDTAGLVVRALAGIVLGLGSLAVLVAAVRNIPTALARRFEVDADGITLLSTAGSVHLEWADVRSIRLVANARQSVGYRSPLLPRSVNRRATTWLDFTLVDPDQLELDQPALTTLRVKDGYFSRHDGYTHGVPILTQAHGPSYDIADYAPRLQWILEVYAGAAYVGAALRDSDPDVG